jgi:UDP-N-acetyl-D-galactosamine dehydrogenase
VQKPYVEQREGGGVGHSRKIAVIGLQLYRFAGRGRLCALGRAGCPDIDRKRIDELRSGPTRSKSRLTISIRPVCTSIMSRRASLGRFLHRDRPAIDSAHRLTLCVLSASDTIGKVLKRGDIVVYESTVYPGVIEEECLSVLEKQSRSFKRTRFSPLAIRSGSIPAANGTV